MITGIVLFSQTAFNNSILLNNLAYDIAITLRQAQTFGVNVRESGVGSGKFSPYGVYFNLNSILGNKGFVLFADTAIGADQKPDLKFTGDPTCKASDPECVQKYSLNKGNYIKDICIGSSDANCISVGSNDLTILFKRPNPDALMYSGTGRAQADAKNYAKITISSGDNSVVKNVVITSVGQIYVQ